MCYILYILYPIPNTLNSILSIKYTIPYTLYYVLYTLYYILYTIYYILYTIYYILHTLYPIPYTIYYIPHTIYSILYTLYSIPYTIYPFFILSGPLGPQSWLGRLLKAKLGASLVRLQAQLQELLAQGSCNYYNVLYHNMIYL